MLILVNNFNALQTYITLIHTYLTFDTYFTYSSILQIWSPLSRVGHGERLARQSPMTQKLKGVQILYILKKLVNSTNFQEK